MFNSIILFFIFIISINVIKSAHISPDDISENGSTTTTSKPMDYNVSSEPIDSISEYLLLYAKEWFDNVKDTRQTIKRESEIGFKEAIYNFTNFNANLLTAKNENVEEAKRWINKNCAKCERDKFSKAIVDDCYKKDDIIRNLKYKFYNYTGCIMQLMFELKKPDQKLDASMKAYEKLEKSLQDNSLQSKDYQQISETLFSLFNTVHVLTQHQLDLLQGFSYLSFAGEHYNPYFGREEKKLDKYFYSQCYQQFNYDYAEDGNGGYNYGVKVLSRSSFWKFFRGCLVKETCTDKNYQEYVELIRSQ